MSFEIPTKAREALEGVRTLSPEEIEERELQAEAAARDRVVAACAFCGEPVDPDDETVYRKVVGFERRRDAGGTNAIALREPLDEFACHGCVYLRRQGLAGQEALDL